MNIPPVITAIHHVSPECNRHQHFWEFVFGANNFLTFCPFVSTSFLFQDESPALLTLTVRLSESCQLKTGRPSNLLRFLWPITNALRLKNQTHRCGAKREKVWAKLQSFCPKQRFTYTILKTFAVRLISYVNYCILRNENCHAHKYEENRKNVNW